MTEKLSLTRENWGWNRELCDVENIPAEKTAVYEADGDALTVGPWIAGKQDVRLVYALPLPLKEGTIRGRFRTEGLYPREGNLWITYKKGERTMTELNFWLGVTDEWREFCFPVFAPLEGCDKILLSFGFHMKTHGYFRIADLTFGEPHQLPMDETAEVVLTREKASESFAPGEFVRLEKTESGTWWLVDTDGKPFYSAGCAMYNNRRTPEDSAPVLERLSINTIANGSSLEDWRDYNEVRRKRGVAPFFQFYRVNTDISARFTSDTICNRHNNPAILQLKCGKTVLHRHIPCYMAFSPDTKTKNRTFACSERPLELFEGDLICHLAHLLLDEYQKKDRI